MEALFFSTAVVALAEMGDKTQLLSFVLAAKLKRKVPIALGILFATLANHSLAGYVIGGAVALLVVASTSCGGGSTCDAYRKADFSKKQSKKAVVKTAVAKIVKLK